MMTYHDVSKRAGLIKLYEQCVEVTNKVNKDLLENLSYSYDYEDK